MIKKNVEINVLKYSITHVRIAALNSTCLIILNNKFYSPKEGQHVNKKMLYLKILFKLSSFWILQNKMKFGIKTMIREHLSSYIFYDIIENV